MAKLSIITRACNRLEYTVLCIREIEKKIGNVDYEHIIVDQNSSDGTGLWLNSLIKEGYYKIKVKFNDVNSGDAKGMSDGNSISDMSSEYVMQFDNDCYPLTDGFAEKMVHYMDNNHSVGALMAYREGVLTRLKVSNICDYNGDKFGDVRFATCCFISRRKILNKIKGCWDFPPMKIGWGNFVSNNLRNMGFSIKKSTTIRVMHTDGTLHQLEKYPLYRAKKITPKTNYSNIEY